MQEFKQFIYYYDGATANNPSGLSKDMMKQGTAFLDSISQLGVQAPPGTKFYINNNDEPVIIGFTGLFELDLGNGGYIKTIKFDETSLNRIDNNDSAMIIMDIVTK